MNKVKKFAMIAAVMGSTVAAKAVGEDEALSTTLTQVTDKLTEAVATILPFIGIAVVAGLSIWLLPKAVRWIKGAFGR